MNQIITSWSEIDTFRQCPFKHHLNYRERWIGGTESPALAKGNLWHAVMEHHYNALRLLGRPLAFINGFPKLGRTKAADQIRWHLAQIDELLGVRDPNRTPVQELVKWMYDGYCECYGLDHEFEILAVEEKFQAELPNPWGGPSRFILKAKIDLVVRWMTNGKLWIWDHKSGANLPGNKELDLDDQMGLYMWLWRQLGHQVDGVIYSAARTQRNKSAMPLDTRFQRVPLLRTDFELREIAAEAYATCERMWPADEDGTLIAYIPERTPNTDTCRWRCDKLEPCLGSRKGIPIRGMLEAHGFHQQMFRDAEIALLDTES